MLDLAHTDHPDEKSVMTYVSSLYEVFPKEPTVQESLHDNVSVFIIWLAPWTGKMNLILCFDWLPEQARWSYLSLSRYGLCSARKFIMFWCFIPYNKSFIDQTRSVKMTGYWILDISVYGPQLCLELCLGHKHAKKNLANIQPSWPHIWSITHTYWK